MRPVENQYADDTILTLTVETIVLAIHSIVFRAVTHDCEKLVLAFRCTLHP